jgi:hypothetical protein
VIGAAAPALASCHAFSVSASPSSVTEGGKVTVTVTRDGDVAPSNIDLTTVNRTAKAGTDYKALSTHVEFTSGTEQTFTVSTINDSVHESTETFALHLSNPGGCFGSGYVVGDDAIVTIIDNDQASLPSPTHTSTPQSTATATAEPETRHASGVPTTSAKPSPRASHSIPSSSPRATPTAVVEAARVQKGSSSAGTIVIVSIVAIGLVASAGFGVYRARTRNR